MESYQNGALLVLLAATLWGTTGTAQALAPEAAQPLVVGTLRLLLGGVVLLALAVGRRLLVNPLRWPPRATFFAVTGIALYQLSFFAGVDRTGVAIGTIVGIGSAPIIGGILGRAVRGEHLTRRWMLSTTLAVLGCTLLIGFSGEAVTVDLLGVLLAMGAGASYAVYTVASKRLLEDHPPDAVIAIVFSLGALLLVPVLFFYDLSWTVAPGGLLVVLHLGVITAAVAYMLFSRGLLRVQAATAVTLTLAEPLTAGLLGVFLLRETLSLPAVVGILLLFLGLALLSVRRPLRVQNVL